MVLSTLDTATADLTADLIEITVSMCRSGWMNGYDVPELWAQIESCSGRLCQQVDQVLVSRAITDPILPAALLFGYRAGRLSLEELSLATDRLMVKYSQSAYIAGFSFYVRKLLEPSNHTLRLEDFICEVPFQQLDILDTSAHLCCASWVKKSAGNLAKSHHDEVWNSEDAAAIRRSILDGSYRFCNKNACHNLHGGRLTPRDQLEKDPWWQRVITENTGINPSPPKHLNLAYDRHCNLSCPSCRTDIITSNDEVRSKLDEMTQRSVFPLLSTAEAVVITGSGDPLASRTFRKILAWISDDTCPNLTVILSTNGMLLTPKEWEKFPNLKGKVTCIRVSMDGAAKASHESLRRGSRWETMLENLAFIGTLLQKGEINEFMIAFVVQDENFPEMGDFVDLGIQVGANAISFDLLTNWGTFTMGDYQSKAVFDQNHPNHAAFLSAMEDPRLRDHRVRLGSLNQFLPAAPSDSGQI